MGGTKATDLLLLYRSLCETVGSANAQGTRLSPQIEGQLERVESQLRALLTSALEMPQRIDAWEGATSSLVGSEAAPQHRPKASPSSSSGLAMIAEVYCDGACLRNPGPGGYGIIVRVSGQPECELQGFKALTTNNEMELTAALLGLRKAIELGATQIAVQSDSQYLTNGITKWLKGWQRNGWKTSTGEPVKNRQLWEDLSLACQGRLITWHWTKGHAGHPENERCDSLAFSCAKAEAERSRR